MAARSKELRQAAAVTGGLARRRGKNDPDYIEAQRNLNALTLEQHVRATLAKFPPLTDEQLDRIAVLLRGGAAA